MRPARQGQRQQRVDAVYGSALPRYLTVGDGMRSHLKGKGQLRQRNTHDFLNPLANFPCHTSSQPSLTTTLHCSRNHQIIIFRQDIVEDPTAFSQNPRILAINYPFLLARTGGFLKVVRALTRPRPSLVTSSPLHLPRVNPGSQPSEAGSRCHRKRFPVS